MAFAGFPREAPRFFEELIKNNNPVWFQENKERYQELVLEPFRDFVSALGACLRELTPDLRADPRVNRSLFRINRDTRFSRDKTPYKDHAGIWLWEGSGKRMECSGFYFQLSPDFLMLGVGLYSFPKDLVEPYRQAVDNSGSGLALSRAVDRIMAAGPYLLGGPQLKRVPRGFPPGHPRADLLKYKGLFAKLETKIWTELHTPGLVERCYEEYRNMAPLHFWLRDMIDGADCC